jgi:hypothetical protein
MSVFLTKAGGITSTSANTLANWAKNEAYAATIELASLTFVNTRVELINGENPKTVGIGAKDTARVGSLLEKIAKLNSFSAWMREGIKAKENLLRELNDLDVEDYAELKGTELPEEPDYPSTVKAEDILNEMDVKKRNNYLRLEAFAAAYGKYVHSTNDSTGAVARARNELAEKIARPTKVEGSGRDCVLYTYAPSASMAEVDEMFNALQETQRSYEQQLNAMKYSIESEVNKRNAKAHGEYNQTLATYHAEMKALREALHEYKIKERERIGRLKIVVPNELKETYEYLNSLGSEK